MPTTQDSHWDFTHWEWSNGDHPQIFQRIFSKGKIGVVYDIGACVGAFTDLITDRIDEAYCFEPDEENYKWMVEHLNRNKVRCFKKGIYYGSKREKVRGFDDYNVGGYFFGPSRLPSYYPVVDHDRYFELDELENFNLPKPDLIKMDVEGAEKNIIENSKIVRECPLVLVEWHYNKESPQDFFKKHLPEHEIIFEGKENQFLLWKK